MLKPLKPGEPMRIKRSNRIKPLSLYMYRERVTIADILYRADMYVRGLIALLSLVIGSTHPSIRILFRTPAPAQRPGELPLRSIRILSSSTERRVWNIIEPSITCSTYLVHIYCTH